MTQQNLDELYEMNWLNNGKKIQLMVRTLTISLKKAWIRS